MSDAPTKRMGRPPTGRPRMGRHQLTLDAATIERAKLLGAGNLSAGIREAVRRVRLPFEPLSPADTQAADTPVPRVLDVDPK